MTLADEYFLEQLRRGELVYVSATGLVWRTAHAGMPLRHKCKLVECLDKCGYRRFSANIGNKIIQSPQHRVIWQFFNGEIPEGYQINHKDFDKTNNRLGNLESITMVENVQHAWAGGRMPFLRGDTHNKTKVPDAAIPRLRQIYRGASIHVIADEARKYGVLPKSLWALINLDNRKFAQEGVHRANGAK